MEERMNDCPLICLDMKKGRLRIYKKTLQQMNCPEHIEILVNPKKKGFIIRTSQEKKNAHRIEVKRLREDRRSYELYSTEFLREVCKVARKLRPENSYRVPGQLSRDGTAAYFSLAKAEKIEAGKEESDD